MRFFLIVCNISVLLFAKIISGSVINRYPISNIVNDDNDPGDALYVTKFIESGDIETARNLSLVSHSDIPMKNYAGYFTVNKKLNSNLFFWFFPAKMNAADAPVLLWLQGGPGTSSLFALFTENGPFSVNSKLEVIPRKYSWHLNHNLIYIDSPVGTGFSFSGFDSGYAKNENDVGRDLLNAVHQFFLLFPELQKNEFFISGESYAGKYVPAIGYAIHQESKRPSTLDGSTMPKINLKGLIIGNGLSDPLHQLNYGDYLYQLGLIDANGRREFIEYQDRAIDCIVKRDFKCAFEVFDTLFIQHPQGSLIQNLTGFNMNFNYLKTEDDNTTAIEDFIKNSKTRRAIHVGNNTFYGFAEIKVLDFLKLDFMDSVANWVAELLSYYPILMYNGQLDIIVAYPLTENFLQHLNFTGAEQYKVAPRYIWRVDNEIAGYAKHAGNLTEVLVRNAGHEVPTDQPKWALDMLLRFTQHKGFH